MAESFLPFDRIFKFMSMYDSIRRQIVPIHPEGYIFIAGFALATVVFGWIWPPFAWIGGIATAWCAYFFRDPPRVTPASDGLVVSPADGIVSSIGYFSPPPEIGMGTSRCSASRFS